MGWDAYATKDMNDALFVWDQSRRSLFIPDEDIRAAFKAASEWVKENTGGVDWLLEHGGLDVSTCGHMLRCAGIDAWDDDLTPEEVKALKPNWEFEYSEGDAWAYWSARKFIEVCQELGLGILFSW